MFDFNEYIDRRNSRCEKWDEMINIFSRENLLPFWVADCDFKVSTAITDALEQRLKHPVFGYEYVDKETYEIINNFVLRHHKLILDVDSYRITPGVMSGVCLGIQVLSNPGDGVLIQTPVYTPFYRAIEGNNRKIIKNPLILKKNTYEIDFDNFEENIKKSKIFLLCSPHNPSGKVFSKDELSKMVEICRKNNVKIISDEIHSDIILEGNNFTNIFSVDPWVKKNAISMIAPSKTFNIPGLTTSVAIIPDIEIRNKFSSQMAAQGLHEGNNFGMAALRAAYTKGDDWIYKLRDYINENKKITIDFFKKNYPSVNIIDSQGTFLLWIDFHNLCDVNKIHKILLDTGKIALSKGEIFGCEGVDFLRFNIGCPLSQLEEGLNRIKKSLDGGNYV